MPITSTILTIRRKLLALVERLHFLAPALIRLTLGVVFVQSGWGKLQNLERTTEFFASLHIPLPHFNAVLASSTEFFGGLLFLVGLGTRLVALPLAFTMVIAIITARAADVDGFTALLGLNPEWDYLVMFLVVAIMGPGALSVDALIARRLARSQSSAQLSPPVLSPDAAPAVR
jgi:putative oxidoreductase